jgi:hypothetical protein
MCGGLARVPRRLALYYRAAIFCLRLQHAVIGGRHCFWIPLIYGDIRDPSPPFESS